MFAILLILKSLDRKEPRTNLATSLLCRTHSSTCSMGNYLLLLNEWKLVNSFVVHVLDNHNGAKKKRWYVN